MPTGCGLSLLPRDVAAVATATPSRYIGAMETGHFLGLSQAGFHRVAYRSAASEAPPVICVHGLTRNSGDFSILARELADIRRVVAPDVVGRGASDWLPDPRLYGYAQYCADMAALIARLDVAQVDWIGTSMGGLIGMMLAAQPGSPIRRLVLNDIGPFVTQSALSRIASYVGNDPVFEDPAALEAYLRRVHAPFGLSDEHWRRLAEQSARRRPDGRLGLAYDPAIAVPIKAAPIEDVDLWALYDRVQCPVLVLRGSLSDILSAETAAEMANRGPRATVKTFEGIGHAPMLMTDDQIAAVRIWLDA